MESREPSRRWRDLADEVIATEPSLAGIRESSVRICYLSSDRERSSRGRIVFAECERVPDKWRWAVPYDFAITVFEPNAARLSGDQLRVLMLHELLHVGVERDGNEERHYVVPHDVEDFMEVVERYGLGWSG